MAQKAIVIVTYDESKYTILTDLGEPVLYNKLLAKLKEIGLTDEQIDGAEIYAAMHSISGKNLKELVKWNDSV